MTWYCGKCRMSFSVGEPSGQSQRHGCPDCGLWFHSGCARVNFVGVTIAPADLAKHKARQTVRPSVHESYVVEETA